jgi:hypothetical protein
MAQPAYRKATRWTGLGIAMFMAGFAGFFLVLFLIQLAGLETALRNWALALALLPMLVAVFLIWFVLSRFNRKRVGGLAACLEGRGFRVSQHPTDSDRTGFAAPVVHLLPSLGLTNGAAGIQWLAVEQAEGAKALIFEHRYTTGSGKTTVEYLHTVFARPAGHREFSDGALPTAPWLFMGKYPGSRRRSRRKHELTSPELADVAQTWSMTGDPATAARFLTPHVRRALETSPAYEAWCLGTGWVCCSFEGTLDAGNMERFLTHSREVLAARS